MRKLSLENKVTTNFSLSAKDYYTLGEIYYYGWSVEKNLKKANKYYSIFLEKTLIYGNYYEIGEIYYYGKGVQKDKIKAYKNLYKAAKNSSLKAQNLLDKLCSESPWACK